MKVSVEKKPKCLAEVKIEAAAEEVKSLRSDMVRKLSKNLKLPGFRPGKVPKKLVEKRFGDGISDDLKISLIRKGLDQLSSDHEEIRVLTVFNPDESNVQLAEDFSALVRVAIEPDFEIPDYSNLEVEVEKLEITDEEIEATLQEVRQTRSTRTPVKRSCRDGDVVSINFKSLCEGKELSEVTNADVSFLAERESFLIKMSEETFLPTFCSKIEGMKAGEKREITVSVPDDFPVEDLHGKELAIAVEMEEVNEEELPDLNDEFAASVFEGATLSDLRGQIRAMLQGQKSEKIEDEKVTQIIEQLSDGLSFELPEHLITAETNNVLQRQITQLIQAGSIRKEDIKAKVEALRDEAREQAVDNLQTHFILTKIAHDAKIAVDEMELFEKIREMADQADTPIEKYIETLQREDKVQGVQASLLISKTIDHLLSIAKVTELEPEDEGDRDVSANADENSANDASKDTDETSKKESEKTETS